jgi:hypothetical protein
MKQGFDSLVTLAQELTRQAQAKRDFIAPASSLVATMNPNGPVLAGFGDVLPINPSALRQISGYLKIPAEYFDRMAKEAPDLWERSVNTWLQKANGDRRMVRTLDGNVRALLSDSYKRIDHFEVAEAALEVLDGVPGLKVVSTAITEAKLYIKAVSTEIVGEVKSKRVGDLVEAGVMISNSEIGQGSVSIKPFLNFLVCTNGMVRDKATMRAAHIGRKRDDLEGLLSDQTRQLEDAAVLSKVRDVIKLAFDAAEFQRVIERMSEQATEQITGNVPKAIEVLGQTYGMTQSEQSSVLRNLIEGGDLSRYGLTNAVTRTAEDLPSYDRATEFETIGGRIVDLAANDWSVIAQAA